MGGGLPCRAAKRSSMSWAEGTGFLGAFKAARRDSISFSEGTDSGLNVVQMVKQYQQARNLANPSSLLKRVCEL